ncbi:zona pellucida sperm-binding protein 4-like [Hoplias malabaricus]|uniref:zona pellucida sperm-binding protein 4-like n=1 Tax=Hoplias malabaricus TaxID=27720 RepID=UPI00346378C1
MWFSVVVGILYGHVSFAAVYQWGPQSVKQPQKPQLPSAAIPVTNGTKPMVSIDKCRVDNVFRVPCGEPSIDAAHCAAINCFFDGHNCYYGNTVTVQCTVDGQFVLVVARDTTLPRLSLDSVYWVQYCVVQYTVLGDYVVYENKMSSSYEVGLGPLGAITRQPF